MPEEDRVHVLVVFGRKIAEHRTQASAAEVVADLKTGEPGEPRSLQVERPQRLSVAGLHRAAWHDRLRLAINRKRPSAGRPYIIRTEKRMVCEVVRMTRHSTSFEIGRRAGNMHFHPAELARDETRTFEWSGTDRHVRPFFQHVHHVV